MTGTYKFKTGYYGMKNLPTEFQKAISSTLLDYKIPDAILIINKEKSGKNYEFVRRCFQKFHNENLRAKFESMTLR